MTTEEDRSALTAEDTRLNAVAAAIGAALGRIMGRIDEWRSHRQEMSRDLQQMLDHTRDMLQGVRDEPGPGAIAKVAQVAHAKKKQVRRPTKTRATAAPRRPPLRKSRPQKKRRSR